MESFCFSHIEDDLHDSFVALRIDGPSGVYVEDPTSKTPLHLNAYCNVSNKEATLPLIVAGAEGIGKSAIIANWTRQRKANAMLSRGLGYQEFVFYHAIGCSRLSTSILHLLRRLITSLINHFDLKEAIDLVDEKLPWVLPRLLERASKKGKVVIVIDGGLQHISSHDEDYGLKWLPLQLPSNVRMILSVTIPCENPPHISDYATRLQNKIKRVWDELHRRKWPMICLKGFDPSQAAAIVDKNLPSESSKVSMPRNILMKSILSHERSTNALFLTTVLKGIRHVKEYFGFTKNEVEQCLTAWTSPSIKSCTDLIESMLMVFEFGPNFQELPSQPRHTLDSNESSRLGTLLSHSLSLLFVSRHGLREDELLELVEHVRENVRWEKQTKDTVIPIKLKILQCIMHKKNRLIDIFRSFDEDGNGTLSREEFYKGMERLNLKGVTQHDVTLLINEVDNNADGEIDYLEILDHFEGISRKYLHGGRRRSVFGSVGSVATTNDRESLNDDFCQNLIATLQCVGVVSINSAHANNGDKILTIPFENRTLRDVIWKRYLRSDEGESLSRNFLIEYFNKKEPCLRICEELPWHLKKSNNLVALKKLLNDLRVLDTMYNTEELKPELFIYLLRLSQGRKFDIVYEYNRSVERWKSRNNPTASQLCGMIAFLAEVMFWYSKNISSQIDTPNFMRRRISDIQLHKLKIDWADILPNSSIVESSDYFVLRWVWIQCPWLSLKGTAKAINQQKKPLSTKETVPREIASKDISSKMLPESSRVRAMIHVGAKSLPKHDNKIQSAEITELNSAYLRLNEVREVYNNLVVEASERESSLLKLQHLVSEISTKEAKKNRALAAEEAILDQLQLRLDHINEMIDGANRVQSVHENILVVLQSCRPSFQTEHLQLEQQIVLSKQQISDLTKQQDVIDNEINEIQASCREMESRTQQVYAEIESVRPQLDAMRRRVKEELDRKRAERNTSFDPSAFNRRMKLEGIIARRRQVRDSNDDESRFVIDVESSSALHPMEKLAYAVGSFDPSVIVDKLKTSEGLSRELSLRQEKQELITTKQRNILQDLHERVQTHYLSADSSANNEINIVDQDLTDAEALFQTRKKSLQRLENLINVVEVAAQHLYSVAESIQHLDEETNQFHFAMEENKSFLSSDAKKIVSCIKAIYIPERKQVTPLHMKKLARKSLDNSFNKRVLNKAELESSYHEATKRALDFEDETYDDRNEVGRTKYDSQEDFRKLTSYVRQSKTNASEIEQRRANTLCRTSQKNKGLILESILQLQCDSPEHRKAK